MEDKYLIQAGMIMKQIEKEYQEKYPCPKCGSHNVHIEIDGIGGGNVSGSEWCDDCGWVKRTDTFPKK